MCDMGVKEELQNVNCITSNLANVLIFMHIYKISLIWFSISNIIFCQRFKEGFTTLDLNQNGLIEVKEMQKLFEIAGENVNDAERFIKMVGQQMGSGERMGELMSILLYINRS
jgi:hypothetical protein